MGENKQEDAGLKIDVRGILERNRDTIARQLEDLTREQLRAAVQQQTAEAVIQTVRKFVEKEIAPALTAKLREMKAAVLKGLLDEAEGLAGDLAKMMFAKARKNLADGYRFSEIAKQIFGW